MVHCGWPPVCSWKSLTQCNYIMQLYYITCVGHFHEQTGGHPAHTSSAGLGMCTTLLPACACRAGWSRLTCRPAGCSSGWPARRQHGANPGPEKQLSPQCSHRKAALRSTAGSMKRGKVPSFQRALGCAKCATLGTVAKRKLFFPAPVGRRKRVARRLAAGTSWQGHGHVLRHREKP